MGSFCRGMSWSVLLLTCGVNAMNMEMNLEKCRLMIRDTHPFTAIEVYNEEVMNAYGGSDLPINWKVIEKVAVEGDPMAQYCHAEHCLAIARTLFNGERKAKKKEAYVFMLISAIFGNFEDSRSAFAYVGGIPLLDDGSPERQVLNFAEEFAGK